MMKVNVRAGLLVFFLLSLFSDLPAQTPAYRDSMEAYFRDYVMNHEVVKGKDKDFISFYPPDEQWRITCHFERVNNSPWFQMETSGLLKKTYRVYGKITFHVHDTALALNIYQSQDLMQQQKYADLLFIPFTDATTGSYTYEGGRYMDIETGDIQGDQVILDFNLAYNPYCAYVSGKYNCPLPPPENFLPVAVQAGEKAYSRPH